MGWVSRFVASVPLWSTLSAEVRSRRLYRLSCLASSERRPPSPFCGTACRQLLHHSVGMCVTWPQEANSPPPRSPRVAQLVGYRRCQKRRISRLAFTFHVMVIPMHLFTFFLAVQCLCVMGKHSAFFSSTHAACIVAPLSGLAQDRIQSKNNPWPCLAVLRGN